MVRIFDSQVYQNITQVFPQLINLKQQTLTITI